MVVDSFPSVAYICRLMHTHVRTHLYALFYRGTLISFTRAWQDSEQVYNRVNMSFAKQQSNPCLTDTPLGIDEACFSVLNEYNRSVTLYSYLSDCYLVRIGYVEALVKIINNVVILTVQRCTASSVTFEKQYHVSRTYKLFPAYILHD